MTTRNLSGWKRQAPDARDWRFSAPPRTIAALAPTVDTSAHMGPQLDQRTIGCCGPNSADEMVMFDQAVEGRQVRSISRLHLYYWTRFVMGSQYLEQDSGVDNRSMMKALATYGFCDESLWPYDVDKFATKPPAAADEAALANRITNYVAVPQDLDQMKAALAKGFPFLFGFNVFRQMTTDETARTGILAMPKGKTVGGHDVTVCGYTDVDQPGVLPQNEWPAKTFKLRNHWREPDGRPWGDGGYGYVPYAYATASKWAGDFWAINALPGVVVPPAPSITTLKPGSYVLPGNATLVIP